jgi:soluble lytic murein transglycosylase-like protein
VQIDEISKLIQIYMYQGMYSGSGSSSSNTSQIFEVVMMNALKSLLGEESTSISSAQMQNSLKETNKDNKENSKDISGSIINAIEDAAAKYGVEKDFIKAVVKQESSFNPQAVSRTGAMGLMQLMPSTAKSMGVENPFNVLENIDGGTRYLKRLMDAFNGNKELALSAYNGGIGRMNNLGVDTVEEISKMPGETKNYVNRVMGSYTSYKKL